MALPEGRARPFGAGRRNRRVPIVDPGALLVESASIYNNLPFLIEAKFNTMIRPLPAARGLAASAIASLMIMALQPGLASAAPYDDASRLFKQGNHAAALEK